MVCRASAILPGQVVAKVEFHFGELFPRVGFIVTNFRTSSRAVVRFYNKRGTAEQWIKEGKQAVAMTRLSCHRFRANEVRLWLSVIAYNLGNLWRRLALPGCGSPGSWVVRTGWSGGLRDGCDPGEDGDDVVGPGPGRGDPQFSPAGAAGESGGHVQ